MLADVPRIYRESLKPADSLFNIYVARPLAAVIVAVLAPTRITPNQVTFISIAIMAGAIGLLVGLPGPLGLWLGVAGIELTYLFDCADGQLARLTRRTSAVGAELDFLMDELKAYLLIGGIAGRWSIHDGGGQWALWCGIGGLVIIGCALSMTKFIRTPEYAQATGTERQRHGQAAGAARSAKRSAAWPIEMAARLISQYPTTLPIFAAFNRLDVFLYAYAGVHGMYVGRTVLVLLIRLGRSAPASTPDS